MNSAATSSESPVERIVFSKCDENIYKHFNLFKKNKDLGSDPNIQEEIRKIFTGVSLEETKKVLHSSNYCRTPAEDENFIHDLEILSEARRVKLPQQCKK